MSAAFASSSDSKMKNAANDNNSNKRTVDSVKKKSFGDKNKKSESTANNSTVIKVKSVIPRRRQDLLKWYGWGYKDSMFKLDNNTASFTGNRSLVLLISVAATFAAPSPASSANTDNSMDKIEPSTHELLSSLGLKKLRIPAAHHRKRLAEQGRRHATGDSRMYVIKLPPNTSYYSHAEPAPAAARTLPLQMTSNGKPARVYHWNIPVLQKFAKNRPQARFDDDIVDVESTPTWTKAISHPNSLDALAYYVPAKKTSFRKYFSGNGKPKSFYIIEKNKKAAEYHKLLP